MEFRPLGTTGLDIAPLMFGGNVFGWTVDEATGFRILDAFVDHGLNAIDTANSYGLGKSETMIGNWLKQSGKRNKVVIATKVGSDVGSGHKDLSAAHIAEQAAASLKRLGIDHIDLYQSHWFVPDVSHEETLGAYDKLIRAGKVGAIGASNFNADQLADALNVAETKGLPRYQTLQNEYNLYTRDTYEGPVQQLTIRENIGNIPYYSLAAGFLTGKYRTEADLSQSQRGRSVGSKYLNERGMRLLAALDQVAERTGAKHGEIALAWMMAQPGVTAPIASATSVEQVAGFRRAVDLKLSDEDLRLLTEAGA